MAEDVPGSHFGMAWNVLYRAISALVIYFVLFFFSFGSVLLMDQFKGCYTLCTVLRPQVNSSSL
jgi:hypothetical protein